MTVGIAVQAGEGLVHGRFGLRERSERKLVRGKLDISSPARAPVRADVLRRCFQGHTGRFVGSKRIEFYSELQALGALLC